MVAAMSSAASSGSSFSARQMVTLLGCLMVALASGTNYVRLRKVIGSSQIQTND
jgi:hypothetical protein